MNFMDKFLNREKPMDTSPQEEKRVEGKIIKVHEAGYGFITSREIEFTRIFFHWTSLVQNTLNFKDLKEGMLVEFTPIEVPMKGWRAIRITVIDEKKDE